MKSLILTTILAIGCTITVPSMAASSYSEIQSKTAVCDEMGKSGVMAFQDKQKGLPKPRAIGGYGGPIDQYAIDYGYDTASEQRNAFMAGWSYCMDNLDRLARAWGR